MRATLSNRFAESSEFVLALESFKTVKIVSTNISRSSCDSSANHSLTALSTKRLSLPVCRQVTNAVPNTCQENGSCCIIMFFSPLSTVVKQSECENSIPMTERRGTKERSFCAIALYPSDAKNSFLNPGPSLLKIYTILFFALSLAHEPAYSARFPPLEWPPTTRRPLQHRAAFSRYATASVCAGTVSM